MNLMLNGDESTSLSWSCVVTAANYVLHTSAFDLLDSNTLISYCCEELVNKASYSNNVMSEPEEVWRSGQTAWKLLSMINMNVKSVLFNCSSVRGTG